MLNSMIAKAENFLLSIATYDGEEQDRIDSEKRQERIKELEAGGTIRRSDSPSQELMGQIERFMNCRTQNWGVYEYL